MKKPTIAIATFVKTPGISPVKTRLAATIGQANAEEFYNRSLLAIESTLLKLRELDSSFVPYWSIAEESALTNERWCNLPVIAQGNGDLGSRLAYVFSELFRTHEKVIFIGGDSPQLQPDIFLDAAASFTAGKDFCLGGTSDGGYYIFAARKDVPDHVWKEVPYSVPTTYEEFRMRLQKLGSLRVLAESFDVDTGEDLHALQDFLIINKNNLNQAQKNLLAWLTRI